MSIHIVICDYNRYRLKHFRICPCVHDTTTSRTHCQHIEANRRTESKSKKKYRPQSEWEMCEAHEGMSPRHEKKTGAHLPASRLMLDKMRFPIDIRVAN